MSHVDILIAEDEAIVAMDLEERLTKLGYRIVACVASGEEAVQKARELRPEIALMDISLRGGMDGIEAAERIRTTCDIPIVYVTAYSDPATLTRAKATEPYAYICKPIEDRQLHTAIEITLHKHASDRKLRRLERWLAATLASVGDAVITTDVQGHVTFMNRIAEDLTAWPRADALGRESGDVFRIIDGRTRQPADSPVLRALREGAVIGLTDGTLLVRRDGREVPIDDSCAPIRDEKGDVSGVVIVFRDVSRQRRAEEDLRRTEEKLRQSAKMEAIGRLAGGIAHDFNNLLTVIQGYSHLVKAELGADHAAGPRLDEIAKATLHAGELTRQLLAFGRKQLLRPTVIDLNAFVGEVKNMLHRLIGEDIALEMSLGAKDARVCVDFVQMELAILNLAANARDAMPRGGTLRIETFDASIEAPEGEAPCGPCVGLSLRDTGSGMGQATLAHVFEPFFTTKELGRARGWVCRRCTGSCGRAAGTSRWLASRAGGRRSRFTCRASPGSPWRRCPRRPRP